MTLTLPKLVKRSVSFVKHLTNDVGQKQAEAERIAAAKAAASRKAAEERERLRVREIIDRILSFPARPMTQQEFDALPRGIHVDFLACPFGTWFVGLPVDAMPGVFVLGHVVTADEAFGDERSARTPLPDRWINRYRLELR